MIDDAELCDLLEAMVRIPSPSREEERIARFLVETLNARGFRAHRDEVGNLVAEIGTGAVENEVVLLGHIDTVPGDLEVRREDGVLHGRGSVDAKAPLAAFIAAAARVAATNADARFVVIGCVEEEVASSKGARHVLSRRAPRYLVVGEPSGWDAITLGYKGFVAARLDIDVPRAHGAHEASSAAELAVLAWSRVEEDARRFNAERERLFDRLMPRLATIESACDERGRDRARATLQWRLPPDLDPAALAARAEARLAGIEGARLSFEVEGVRAWSGPRTTELHRRFLGAIRARGGRARCLLKTGTADLNLVAPAWGCPALAYGPGDAALDHAPDERIELDELVRGAAVLEEALAALTARG
ncbi:MAG: [LysW]-lysine hydrolase [Planctomycetota bacterium]